MGNEHIQTTEQEEEAWEQARQSHDIHTRNRASMNAWKEAGMYVAQNADKLGRLTLRQAFEEGYRLGYMEGANNG
ncbi:MAG: hypothetical protein AMK69_20310 [Nitrospira bacterium SG8_3]|nr:MAG: hypothetical protein AMK69_20310 [Nitrospira bacterium SG8_3]